MAEIALFPGQGSQHVGMGKFLFDEFASARQVFEEASDTLSIDFKKLCFAGDEAELALTHNTQPALLTVSVATYRTLKDLIASNWIGGAGHSIGEYAALVNAEVMTFADGVRAVRKRGELMQSAVPVGQGGMAAVMGMDDGQVRSLCGWVQKETGKTLEPANFNAPGQIVISGHKAALEWLTANYSEKAFTGAPTRAKFIPLKVSAPFHCSLMKPAEESMALVLNEISFKNAAYPIVQNYTALTHTSAVELKNNLIKQITAPVRWVESVKSLQALNATLFIEVGCGKVLNGLCKKIDPERIKVLNLNSLDELRETEKLLKS